MKTVVSYGNGYGKGAAKPLPCSENEDHLTPPGMHITAHHAGAKYGPSQSLILLGLEGQTPAKRAILIHTAGSVGAATSWGCTGVANGIFPAVQEKIGEGSLVYNYFGSTSLAPGCNTSAGMGPQHAVCSGPGAGLPSSTTSGGGSGAAY